MSVLPPGGEAERYTSAPLPQPHVATPAKGASEWWFLSRMPWETLYRRADDLHMPRDRAESWCHTLYGFAAASGLAFIGAVLSKTWVAALLFAALAIGGCVVARIMGSVANDLGDSFETQKTHLLREMDEMRKNFKDVPVEDENVPKP